MIEITTVPNLSDFARTGIYFLYRSGVVVYVGQAVDVRRRIGEHISEGRKAFDGISMMPCSSSELARREKRFIEKFRPEYNNCPLSKVLRDGYDDPVDHDVGFPAWEPRLDHLSAAAYLGITEDELTRLVKDGRGPRRRRLPRNNHVEYDPQDLRAFARQSAVGATER